MSSTTFTLAELQKNWIIRAGAGAGKTTELVQRVLQMAQQFKQANGEFPHLVITTFTRKATQELKERLGKAALELGDRELFLYVNSASRLQISTIHGVLVRFLNKYATLKHISPTLSFISEVENQKLARKIVKNLAAENEIQLLQDHYTFNEIVALCSEFCEEWMINPSLHNVGFEDLKAIFYSEIVEWIAELKLNVSVMLEENTNDKWSSYLSELNNICQRTPADLVVHLHEILDFLDNNSKPRYLSKNPPFTESLAKKFDELRDKGAEFQSESYYREASWQKHQLLGGEFLSFAQKFAKIFYDKKIQLGSITMTDLEGLSLRLLQEHPELGEAFSSEWDYWFVDEYQDTSPRQVELLNALIGNKHRFIVGDPQQSIYLFRGARSEVFHEAEIRMKQWGAESKPKMKNYRSQPSLLKFINHMFSNIGEQFSAMEPRELVADNHQSEDVLVLKEVLSEGQETPDELQIAVWRIQALLRQGVKPEQICVLARQNKILVELGRLCNDLGTPVQLHSSSSYFDRREIQDALALLKFIINPHDNQNLIQLLRTPWLKVEDSVIASIADKKCYSYWQKILDDKKAQDQESGFALLKSLLQEAKTSGVGWVWQKYLVELGLFDFCKLLDATGVREANLWKFVHRVRAQERSSGLNYLNFIDEMTSVISDQGEDDGQATPVVVPSRVNLMTVHASKGLQFEHVIVISMGKKASAAKSQNIQFAEHDNKFTLLVPVDESKKEKSLLAKKINDEMDVRAALEMQRVLYVAATRASLSLTFVMPQKQGSGSWSELWPMALEEGEYKQEGFTYRVQNATEFPVKFSLQLEHVVNIPKPFSEGVIISSKVDEGVTALIKRGSNSDLIGFEKSLNSLAKANSGAQIHEAFEALQYKGRPWVESHIKSFTSAPAKLLAQIDFLYRVEGQIMSHLLEHGHAEYGYSVQTSWGLWSGQIDLWGFDVQGQAWVVDYKTGSSLYLQKALDQLRIYAWSLYRLKKVEQSASIKIMAIYTGSEEHRVEVIQNFTEIDSWLQNFVIQQSGK